MALAPLVASVAVDISTAMSQSLAERAAQAGLHNVSAEVSDLRRFRLPPASVDLVVSNYALHHLADADKRIVVTQAARWLRPGGRLVIADMMFGRGASQTGPRDTAAESDRPRGEGTQRRVADREEPGPVRAARRAGAPGPAGVLASRPACGGLRRGDLPSDHGGSRDCLRRPAALLTARVVSATCLY